MKKAAQGNRYTNIINGNSGYVFEYDYFLKDHLGNTWITLTQKRHGNIW
jgi:hypothetical protein